MAEPVLVNRTRFTSSLKKKKPELYATLCKKDFNISL